MKKLTLLLLSVFFQFCFLGIENPLDEKKSSDDNAGWMMLALFSGGARPTVQATDRPSVILPEGIDSVNITRSNIPAPEHFQGAFRAIGDVYEIGDPSNPIKFENGYAKLEYIVDINKLEESGLLPEFQVFWFDRVSQEWKPVDRVSFDPSRNVLTAYTSHLTPFVPAATIASSGDTAAPPACIAEDYPTTIGGNSANSAGFMVVGEGFQYYKDRTYTIIPTSHSTFNQTSFAAYGFSNAIGVATCNGNGSGIADCGPEAQEKNYGGNDYIVFTTQSNIDLYLMYDTRGGNGDLSNASNDASWIQASGFTNTGHFIETTDPMQFYRIYRRSYNAGEEVRLHGNKNGIGNGNINTNYWLILKPQGNTDVVPSSSLCVTSPPANPGSASMIIRQGGTNIDHGGNYNFGTTNPGGSIGSINFSIHNFGDSDLQLTGTPVVSITGSDAGYFHVVQPTFPISSGQSASYTVNFTPVTAGMKFAIMKVESSDIGIPSYTIGLQGYAPSSNKSISSFNLQSPVAVGNIIGNDIELSVPFGTDVTNLVAEFTFTGVHVRAGGFFQTSGVTANNFTNPVVYTVQAEDGTTQDYTVTVTVQLPLPIFNPEPGHYDAPTYITITSLTGGATIHYTTDGTDPTTSSPVYENPIHIWGIAGKTIKAISILGSNSSAVSTAGNYSYPPLQTGQTTSYYPSDDGNFQSGVERGYIDNGNGTVTDIATGLIWRTCSQGLSGDSCGTGTAAMMNWQNAQTGLNGCNALNLANGGSGYAGIQTWRLPSRQELETLSDYSNYQPAVDTTAFPATQSSGHWTSTTLPFNPTAAWNVGGSFGGIGSPQKTGDIYYVRCVSGQ